MMYSIPTPDEYKEYFKSQQERIMNSFLEEVCRSLTAGLSNLVFEFPEKLSPEYTKKVKEIFEKKGWKVKYSGISSKHLILLFSDVGQRQSQQAKNL